MLWGTTMLAHAGSMGTPEPWYTHLEISASGGPNWFKTKDTNLVISPFETDSNLVDSLSNKGTWKVGIGYYFFDNELNTRSYLNHLLLELNVYQASGTLKGYVWQYQLPEFNNYTFRAPFTSTRLMFDFKPYLFTWNRLSSYLILGIGPTWNTISYQERVIATDIDPLSNLVLSKYTSTQLAGDVGVGLSLNLTQRLSVTTEYIYGFLGRASPENNPINGVRLSDSPRFSFQTQTLLFGLSLKFDKDML
jgi:opacity protein-like surface antigen